MTNGLLTLAKRANVDPHMAAKREQLSHLIKLLGGGLGLGVVGRGALEFAKAPPLEVPFVSPGPSTLPIPIAEEEQPLQKLAGAVYDYIANMIPDGIDPLTTWLGQNVSSPIKAPIMYPLSFGAAGAGVGGGWALTDAWFKQRRQAKMKEELDRAKSDFQNALLEQSRAANPQLRQKTASDVGDKLDRLFDILTEHQGAVVAEAQKQGNFADSASAIPGAYLTAMALLAAGTGYGTYAMTKKRSPAKLLQTAIRERGRSLWNRSPQAVQVIPTPIAVRPDDADGTV